MAVRVTGKPSSLHCGLNLQIIRKCKRCRKKKLTDKKLTISRKSGVVLATSTVIQTLLGVTIFTTMCKTAR